MTRPPPPFPFFVGCGRSGTTLVRAIFDAHPLLAVPDESYFPYAFALRRRTYEVGGIVDVARFCADLAEDGSFARWGVPIEEIAEALREHPPEVLSDALRSVFATYARAQGKPRYADKTPVFVRHMPALAGLFPESVFVHVVRDGRDVALSRIATDWSTERVDSEALIWSSAVTTGRRSGARLGSRRYRELRYEALVDDPEAAVRDICEFIYLDFDPSMLAHHERASDLVAALPHPHQHGNVLRAPARTRDWRTEMTGDDLAVFEAIAGPALTEMGYERGTSRIPAGVRLGAVSRRARWRLSRGRKALRRLAWRLLHSVRRR
ncbi:MAG: sulfotransferase [Acidimicrobiia bacterium]|nr:sulfotransferase [Acidimicrobiia bacterium]